MKEYFSHDYNARNDPKLQEVLLEHGIAGLGVFWCLIENLYEQGGELPLTAFKSIAFALHTESNIVESVVRDFNLFQNDGEKFWSNSVNARINKRNDITEKRKQAALSSWLSRREKQMQSKPDANVMDCNAIKENKRKEKNKSISNDIDNGAKPHSRFIPPTLEEVKAYVLEKGFTMDCERFIDFYESKGWMVGKNKMKDWKAAVRNWAKGESSRPASSPRKTKSSESRNVNDEWQ